MDLYVVSIPDDFSRVRIVTAVRDAMRLLREDPSYPIVGAVDAIEAGLPILVGSTDQDHALRAAQEALEGLGYTTATLEAGESPESLRMDEVAPAEPDEDIAVEAASFITASQMALAAMSFADGSASLAVSYLATLNHIDPDGPAAAAINLLLDTFPPMETQIAVAEAIVEHAREMSDDEHPA